MRLIDADSVIKEIYNQKLLTREPAVVKCVEIIKKAATFVGSPRRRGTWVEDKYGYNACSECGYEWDMPEYDEAKYCPQCGALME